MNYAIRMTFKWSEVSVLFHDLKEAKALVVYEHMDGTRPHIHAYVEEMTITPQTMKNRLTRLLGFKPHKTDWSFKTDADRKFITYMSKGHLQPSYVKNIDEAEIDGYRSQWIERRQPSPEMKAKSITSWDIAQELANIIDEKRELRVVYKDAYVTRHEWYEIPPEEIIKECIEVHKKYRKTFCDFSLIRVIQTAYGISSSDKFKESLVRTVMNKLFPQ